MVEVKGVLEGLDREWMWLMLEAKYLGIDKEEVKKFLKKYGDKN
ncbi:anti-repressor SinI family protein [Bacillus sp. FSL K6-3431]